MPPGVRLFRLQARYIRASVAGPAMMAFMAAAWAAGRKRGFGVWRDSGGGGGVQDGIYDWNINSVGIIGWSNEQLEFLGPFKADVDVDGGDQKPRNGGFLQIDCPLARSA